MSDGTEATVERLRRESPVVEAIRRQIERQVEADRVEAVRTFAEVFFSKAPRDLLEERSSDALVRMALGAFDFLEAARPDQVDVSVVNPDVDQAEGWFAPVTVIRTNVSERPFIVDTIREYLHSRDLAIEHNIYPILHVERDADGAITEIGPPREGEPQESLVHCEVARITDDEARAEIREEIERRLGDVVRATEDFDAMVDSVNDVVAELAEVGGHLPDRKEELSEVQAFLRWLRDGGFVFLGYRGYDLRETDEGKRAIVVESDSGLGILREESESRYSDPVALEKMEPALRELVEGGPTLIISKTNAESTVHRRARMDYIGVKKLDRDGQVVGEHRFVGLLTSHAYAEEAEEIPILRDKLHHILDEEGVPKGTHDYKEIITIFNSLPKEELFLTSAEEIRDDIRTILTSYHTHDVRVSIREDPLKRGTSVMVILPKERFSGAVRRKIEAALVQRFEGEVLNYHLALGSGDQARLHFYLTTTPERLDTISTDDLEEVVGELIRTWEDRVREGLERVRPPDEARRLARDYSEAFSAEYRAATDPEDSVRDILELEAMTADDRVVSVAFSNPEDSPAAAGGEPITELRLYLRKERVVLSDFMPILENAGLRVIAVNPFELSDPDGDGRAVRAVIYTFAVQGPDGLPLDVEERGSLLGEAILAVRRGDATSDTLNGLVVSAGLAWREVDLLRAYASYAFQLGAVPSRLSLPSALTKYPETARILFELFRTRFDPDGSKNRDERRRAMAEVDRRFAGSLAEVGLLADDRALRRLHTLIHGTVRTNYYRYGGSTPTRTSGGAPYISFKVAVRELESIARSRLLYEVWVRSSRMEGVHLRGAKVARGGIRWSDRPDDFRTEVLGLVSTQMTKNAVIVPAGSKGGFVTLREPRDPADFAQEGRDQYKTLIRGLLDLTDDLDDAGEPVGPDGVVCWDEPDPYLVVAADKGTAQFSDLANEVAAEYGFWLGDAFASGGSQGYDHKDVGITARGAWWCVRRHFLEKGKDIQEEPFTVVGIGDMSGDVFGNGMLLSKKIKLVAAFDHRHVFLDPDPDLEATWEERKRLFEMERSTWDDYDRSLLSEGGMIVPRGAKEVELTPEVRRVLGIDGADDDEAREGSNGPTGAGGNEEVPGPEGAGDAIEATTLDGEALIRAVLRAPVELLWNGGIGTYVKASAETHADVGDPPNDAVRVDASDLRCQIVGEGGNLGFTQKARVEYALAGGRLNTDALDNSGGVDLSDREVNLKILLNPAVKDGVMSRDDRNRLLRKLTDPVAEQVVEDNRSQSLAISLDERRAVDGLDHFRDLMSSLEREGILDRAAEDLPSWEELVERRESGEALTRPELCILLAYSKLHLMSRLLDSELPDEEVTLPYLLEYFPAAAQESAGEDHLEAHRLKREIVSSQLTNDLVDLMGSTFVHRVARDSGEDPARVAWAWVVASRLAGHRRLMGELEKRAPDVPIAVAYRWLLGLSRLLARSSRWVLANVETGRPAGEVVRENREGLASLREAFPGLVRGDDREIFEARVSELRRLGADEDFARELITLRFLDQLLEILRVARGADAEPEDAAEAFYQASELLNLSWLRRNIFEVAESDRWEQRTAQALVEDLTKAQRAIAQRLVGAEAVARRPGAPGPAEVLDGTRKLSRFQSLVDEIQGEDQVTLAGLSVLVREVSALAAEI